MKTTSITVERNFHIMNDDRFIMEKISVSVEFGEHDTGNAPGTQEAINIAREQIIQNFKAAYPHIYTYLNFEDVIKVEKDNPPYVYPKPFPHENTMVITDIKPNEKINKGTIEEQIDKSFDLVDVINKANTLKQLKENQYLLKTEEEKNAYSLKFIELSEKKQTV